MATTPTPYDGKVFVWHVYGGMIAERSIDELARTVRQFAPSVNGIFVKITDGLDWMGKFEPKKDFAINSPADIDRWVQILSRYGLEFHAWALPKGELPIPEAALMVSACMRPGVKSLVLDVEAHPGFFVGGKSAVRPFVDALRRGLGNQFHIGMSVDPRPQYRDTIFPAEWRPYINSLHPQTYWGAFGQTPDATLKTVYSTWADFGLPIIPALQGYEVTQANMDRARSVAVQTYKATGVSWYSLGGIGAEQFKAVNVTIASTTPPADIPELPPVTGTGVYAKEIIVRAGQPNFREGTYNANQPSPLISFQNEAGFLSRYKQTSATASTVWVRWDPQLRGGGNWEISVYVAAQHATTTNARYKIHGIYGRTDDLEVAIKQDPIDNLWASLGVFTLSATDTTAGVVFSNDLTREVGKEITFDAIRWRQVTGLTGTLTYLADGFDSPVGTPEERKAAKGYAASWVSATGYGKRYFLSGDPTRPAVQSGDDIVSKAGEAATGHQPIFAMGSGIVVTADRYPDYWGNVIVIRHDPHIATGKVYYSRYARIESMQVKAGDRVVRGQYIANVGNGFGVFRYHLHIDVSPSAVLAAQPWDWIGTDENRLRANYINPAEFIANNRPVTP